MKPAYITTVLAAIVLLALSPANGHAGNRQVGGLVLGGGTGAIIGQTIGKDTESTLVGATVGGVLGVIIGNELERNHGSVNHPTQVVAHSQRYDNRRYHSRTPRPVFKDHYRNNHYRGYSHDRYDRRNCRKIVTVQKGYYGTKRIISTVCGTGPRYPYKKHNSFRFNDRFHR
jgi:hypothetical protein